MHISVKINQKPTVIFIFQCEPMHQFYKLQMYSFQISKSVWLLDMNQIGRGTYCSKLKQDIFQIPALTSKSN